MTMNLARSSRSAAALVGAPGLARAQAFPERPLHFVVPYARAARPTPPRVSSPNG